MDYPIDGYETTGIRRLKRLQLSHEGVLEKVNLPEGAYKLTNEISLNLLDIKSDSLEKILKKDPELQKRVTNLFTGLDKNYSISILNMSDPENLQYAEKNGLTGYQPGSVGKLIVVTALFCELEKIYPDEWEKRVSLLKEKIVRGGEWVLTDEHTIPVFDPETLKFNKRQAIASDQFSLYEWADHMLSVSNNGAASVVWREVLLMAAFGERYPALSEEEVNEYFKQTSRKDLTDLAIETINQPLRDLGIAEDEWRLGSFFTKGADKLVGSKGGSIGTTIGLIKWLVKLEQGKIIDENSSLEIKRLLYMTDRRIRYAQAPQLKSAAVYFKSGSLYKCDRVKNPDCKKYEGNVYNYMNSVAIIEHRDSSKYLVCLMSNVLEKNSAGDHLALATSIDKLMH